MQFRVVFLSFIRKFCFFKWKYCDTFGVFCAPTQNTSYSAKDTFEGENYTENKSCVEIHFGINVKCWSLLVALVNVLE